MNKLKILVGISSILIPTFLFAQNWQALDTGQAHQVRTLFADTITNTLYAGNYTTGSGSNCFSYWNGSTWDTLGFVEGNVYSINRFQGKIIVANGYILEWNSSNWNSLGALPNNGVVGLFNNNDNDLFAVGGFDTIGGVPASRVAKWNGTNWSAIDTTHWIGGLINCAIMYNGELYIAGNFWDNAGTISRIARWDGTRWQSPGNGIVGGSFIMSLEVYKNELYVGGYFSEANGNPGNNIAKWNGTQWSDVGGGTEAFASVSSLKVYNGYLYAAGGYTTAGGVPATNIAKWDGTNWCSIGYQATGFTGIGITSMAVLNNDLYIGGSFTAIDGDSMNYISRWIGGNYVDSCGHLSIGINEESIINEYLNIYPNPTTNQITLEFDLIENKNTSIEIKNILGQTLRKIDNGFSNGNNKIEIDLSEFASGLYLVSLQNGDQLVSKKIIKQ